MDAAAICDITLDIIILRFAFYIIQASKSKGSQHDSDPPSLEEDETDAAYYYRAAGR